MAWTLLVMGLIPVALISWPKKLTLETPKIYLSGRTTRRYPSAAVVPVGGVRRGRCRCQRLSSRHPPWKKSTKVEYQLYEVKNAHNNAAILLL